MVSADLIRASNQGISAAFPDGFVAVIVGATNGVGETTVRQLAKYSSKPRVYLIGRSQQAGERIVGECKALCPQGIFKFIARETHLMRNVEEVCAEIAAKEKAINLLFLSIGSLEIDRYTEEGIYYSTALTVHARNRFIASLLPQLRAATGLRRVVTVFSGGFEGRINLDDFQAARTRGMAGMAHTASITTLALEAHHRDAPEIAFVHCFPGAVESGIARGSIGPLMRTLKTIWAVLGPLVHIPIEEAGDRHLFFATSARYPPSESGSAGVPLPEGVDVARGTDGKPASGVYSINEKGECASAKVEKTLAQLRQEGMVDKVEQQIRTDIDKALKA